MYIININYDTGDSFHAETDITAALDVTWENYDIVLKNLDRIKDHYAHYQLQEEFGKSYGEFRNISNQKIKKYKEQFLKNLKQKVWFRDSIYWEGSLILLTDDGGSFTQSAFWCGHFERFNFVTIDILNPKNEGGSFVSVSTLIDLYNFK
jgi:hypothetical protein